MHKQSAQKLVRMNYSRRIINKWNNLPDYIICSDSLSNFKQNFDIFKSNVCMELADQVKQALAALYLAVLIIIIIIIHQSYQRLQESTVHTSYTYFNV